VSGRLPLGALALVAVALVAALAVAYLGWERPEDDGGGGGGARPTVPVPGVEAPPTVQPPVARPSSPVAAGTNLLPRTVFFGDTVTAQVDLVLDRRRVDPDSVRMAATFSPWEVVGKPRRERRDAGSTTFLRATYVLRCLSSPCVPSGQAAPLQFDPARVVLTRRGVGAGSTERLRLEWPLLTVYSRFASAAFEGRRGLSSPWRAELVELPEPSHPVSPLALTGLLAGLGLLLLAASGTLVYLVWPRPAPPPPEPEPPPPPRLTPLEQALALLEEAAGENGAAERRRSLELVAEALEEWGDPDLARWARVLAWSESAPEADETADLAARVRATLERERDRRRDAEEVGGHVG